MLVLEPSPPVSALSATKELIPDPTPDVIPCSNASPMSLPRKIPAPVATAVEPTLDLIAVLSSGEKPSTFKLSPSSAPM